MKNRKQNIKILMVFSSLFLLIFTSYAQNTKDCTADFTFEISESINKPSVIQFHDQSIGSPTNWEWNFGDGSTSYGQNPLHYFPENKDFQVSLKISSDSCNDMIEKTITINVPLNISFTQRLDSLNKTPNTFIFSTEFTGFYDLHFWDFGDGVLANVEDTVHSYLLQDHDYQVCLTAQYNFNDTSFMKKVSCKGLTTSEYFDMGGQVYFGDSLMNNPHSTGDTGMAYLYRVNGNNIVPIDTNYFINLGYYWFPQKLKAYYIIKAAFLPNSTHFENFAPTYVGNTSQWDEAEIINLAQNKYREDINLLSLKSRNSGSTQLEGSIDELLEINSNFDEAIACLFNMENQLIDYQSVDKSGKYIFPQVEKGHYLLSADYTGIHVRPQLIYIDGKREEKFKNSMISPSNDIFPNPATSYSILNYHNEDLSKTIRVQIINSEAEILQETEFTAVRGDNYFRIDLNNFAKGMIFIRILDGNNTVYKLIHQ